MFELNWMNFSFCHRDTPLYMTVAHFRGLRTLFLEEEEEEEEEDEEEEEICLVSIVARAHRAAALSLSAVDGCEELFDEIHSGSW